MWQKKEPCFMITAVLMLASSAFCLEIMTKGKSVYYGRLIIGSSRRTNEHLVENLHDEHAGDTDGYQSDQPRLTGESQMAESMLRRWSPSVKCDHDSMSLHVQRSRLPNFLVETSEEGPVPFFRMPSHCGFSVKRAGRDISLVAKYDGCNVAQQENTYVLPLRVLGTVVKVVCPVDLPLTMVNCSPLAMVVNLGTSPDAVRLKVNGVWEPVYQASTCGFALEVANVGLALTAPYKSNCWQFQGAEMLLSLRHKDGELTLSCPAVQHPTTVPLPVDTHVLPTSPLPQVDVGYPFYGYNMPGHFQYNSPKIPPAGMPPFAYGIPWWFQYSSPGTHSDTSTTQATSTIPTTEVKTTKTTVAPAGMPPFAYGIPWWFQYSSPEIHPDTTTTPTNKMSATTVAPAKIDQQVLYPGLPEMYSYNYGMPWWFHYSQPGISKTTAPSTATTTKTPTAPSTATTTKTPTTPATTVAPASQLVLHPWYTYGHRRPWQFQYSKPGILPVTHTTTVPTTNKTPPATTVAQANAAQLAFYPWHRYRPWQFQYSMPGIFPVTHTTAPTTSKTNPGTTVAPASAAQLAFYPWHRYRPWQFQYSMPGIFPGTHTTAPTIPNTNPGTTVAPASAAQVVLYPWYPNGYHGPWQFQYSQPGMFPVTRRTTAPTTTKTTLATTVAPANANQPVLYPWLLGMYKPHVPVSSPDVPGSGPKNGIKQQMYQMPWINYLPKYSTSNIKPGSVVGHPSKVLSHPAYFSPLLVKAG